MEQQPQHYLTTTNNNKTTTKNNKCHNNNIIYDDDDDDDDVSKFTTTTTSSSSSPSKSKSMIMMSVFPFLKLIKNNKILFELYCWLSLLFIFISYELGGPILFILQTSLPAIACFWDYHNSNTMKNNINRIVNRKLVPNKFQVLLGMYMTIITSQSIALCIAIYSSKSFELFALFDDSPSTKQKHYDIRLLRNIIYCIMFNEIIFSTTHRYFLHGTKIGSTIHEIHHTCRPSSFSTSFIFHFLDSNIEFTISFCAMAIFCNMCLVDPFALKFALHITYMWYTVGDHSENMKLGHYWHHHYINSNYTAYSTSIKYFWPRPKIDYVRERIFSTNNGETSKQKKTKDEK